MDPLNFPIKINNQIAALARTVETGDNPPTAQNYKIFELLTGRLAEIQAKYNQAMKVDVGKFNDVLGAHKLAPISLEAKYAYRSEPNFQCQPGRSPFEMPGH